MIVPTCTLLIMKLCQALLNFLRRIRLKTYMYFVLVVTVIALWMYLQANQPVYSRSNRIYILHTSSDIVPDENEEKSDNDENGKWEVEGWDYFAKSEDFSNKYQNHKEFLGKEYFNGIWIPSTSRNWIHLSQFQDPVTFMGYRKVPLLVGIGFRFYVKGDAGLEIGFSYDSKKLNELIRILPASDGIVNGEVNSTRSRLCSKLVDVPSIDIDEIWIRGIMPKSKDSMVGIDKIMVTLGTETSRKNLLYTLLPNQWCSKEGITFQTPEILTRTTNHIKFIKKIS